MEKLILLIILRCQRVGQVQLKENIAAAVESLLGPVRDEVPDSSVGHMDGTK